MATSNHLQITKMNFQFTSKYLNETKYVIIFKKSNIAIVIVSATTTLIKIS